MPKPARSCTCTICQRAASACAGASASAARATAREAGCTDWRASRPARASASAASMPAPGCRLRTAMPSRVSVPVLSKTRVSTPARASRPCRLRTSTPPRASVPAAVSMATGVASDSAQGQVTISTAAATISAWLGLAGHHQAAASAAAASTAIRNGRATRSASCARRGFCSEALSISDTICANCVPSPTAVSLTCTGASRL